MSLELDPEVLQQLTRVSDTGLLTLFGRALESRNRGCLDDPQAEALAEAMKPALARSDRPLHRRLARGRISRVLGVYMGLRARHFDRLALDFCVRRGGEGEVPVVVNLGCGLDSRFFRLRAQLSDQLSDQLSARQPGQAFELIDVDLPAMIGLKAKLMAPEPGYSQLAADVSRPDWIGKLPLERPLIFLAEGLLMYLEPEDVRALVLGLRVRSPGCELVAEVVRRRWLEGWRRKVLDRKLQGNFSIDASVGFRFGVESGEELAGWGDGIEVLGEWSLFDEGAPGLRGMNWMGRVDGLRRLQWVIHWRLGSRTPGKIPQPNNPETSTEVFARSSQ